MICTKFEIGLLVLEKKIFEKISKKFHEIFMIVAWLVHNDGSWTLLMNIFIKCSSWTNDEYLWTFIQIYFHGKWTIIWILWMLLSICLQKLQMINIFLSSWIFMNIYEFFKIRWKFKYFQGNEHSWIFMIIYLFQINISFVFMNIYEHSWIFSRGHQGFFHAVFGSDYRTHSQRQIGLYFPKIWTKFPNFIL
jgi:hypothetical protein